MKTKPVNLRADNITNALSELVHEAITKAHRNTPPIVGQKMGTGVPFRLGDTSKELESAYEEYKKALVDLQISVHELRGIMLETNEKIANLID